MSLQAIEPSPQLLRRQQSLPGKVQGRLKTALLLMAHEGLTDNQAAIKAGINLYSLRLAMHRHHVRAFFREECEVFRASVRGRANFRMVELSEQNDNVAAAVTATRVLIGEHDQSDSTSHRNSSPGLTIVIEAPHNIPHVVTETAKPLIEHEPLRSDER